MTSAGGDNPNDVRQLAQRYFDATARRDLDAMEACWEPGSVENIAPVGELSVPEEYRAYFAEIFEAFPDFRYEVLEVLAEGNKVAVHWRAHGTFDGRPYQGLQPNGRTGSIAGIDMLEFAGGKIVRNDVYFDSGTFMRTLGLLPEVGSIGERLAKGLFNARVKATKATKAIGGRRKRAG